MVGAWVAVVALVAGGLGDGPQLPGFARRGPDVEAGEPVLRFNGKDLEGFYTYLHDSKYDDPRGVFRVEDGAVRVSGEEFGGFITKGEYADYLLVVEWRWGERTFPPREGRARDSGILVHGVGEDGAAGGNWLESQECQVIEGGCGDLLMVGGAGKPRLTVECREGADGQPYFEPGGEARTRDSGRFNWWGRDPAWKDELGFRGARDVEKPAGEWNRMEVVCDGDTIECYVNGILVNRGTGSSLTKGKILFQSEGAEILFRKIEVRPLKK
jgi:hypothetical protein